MKTFILFLLFPLQMLAQPAPDGEKDITGLWKGTVITPELNLPYELVITRKNGILSGYSHTTFTVRGEEIVSVKKVTVKFKNDKIIIEDEDMLFNNFKEEAPKKIKQTNRVTLDESGKAWKLYGTFEARAQRMLKPAEGTIELEKKESPADTKLVAKLGELNLANTISFTFNNPEQKEPLVTALDKASPEKTGASPAIADYGKRVTVPEDSVALAKTAPAQTTTSISNPDNAVVAKTETAATVQAPPVVINVTKKPVILSTRPTITKKPLPALTAINTTAKIAPPETTDMVQAPPVVINVSKKPVILTARPTIAKKPLPALTAINTTRKIAPPETTVTEIAKEKTPVVADKAIAKANVTATTTGTRPASSVVKQPIPSKPVAVATPAAASSKPPAQAAAKIPTVPKPTPVNIVVAPALDFAKRQIETIQQLFIESDSLQFTLYDNGEIDGDTVSVALNGKTIVSRQGLNTTAFTKTVYITPDLGDSVQLIMYAENLGSLPPNTGLLVLQYDNKRQEIRFSGDLNKNAAITLRRKKTE